MQSKNDISDELRSLSALVAEIGRQTPYKLPEGYFEGLPSLILGLVLNPTKDEGIPSNLAKSLTFSVPEGYFDNFASQVLGRIKAGAGNAPIDFISNDFMTESVQDELTRLSAVVSRIPRENPYRLPEGYFAEISPILSVLKDKATYHVPEGYFNYLPAAATEKVIHEAARAKVVAIGSKGKLVKGHWWKYASVAAAACLILVFSWPQLHTSMTRTAEGQHPMGKVDLASTMSQGLHKVSDQEILSYLDDQNSILGKSVSNNTANLDMNDSNIKTLLGNVPDGELQQYMEEHGRADDIATN